MMDKDRARELIAELKKLSETRYEMLLLARLEKNVNVSVVPDFEHEEWRDVVGYEGLYKVSNKGRIFSSRPRYQRLRKICENANGYTYLTLRDRYGKNKLCQIHRLVAEAFLPNPEHKPFVNHKNSIRNDNRVENLEWTTAAENAKHGYDVGNNKGRMGLTHENAKLTAEIVRYMRQNYVPKDKKFGINAMARAFNVSGAVVHAVVHRKSYRDVE